MKKMLLSMLAVTALLGAASLCSAQGEMKPVVTVSFAGYDKLMVDIDTIGRLGGNPDVSKGLDMMLKLMTQGKGLAGLDTKQPWGAVLQADGQKIVPLIGFLPVSDLKQLAEVATANPQLAEFIKLNGDVYEIQRPGSPSIYVKQIGKWAVVADKSDNLAKAPADPLKLLGDLPERYGLAVRASLTNLPKEYREQLLAQARAGAEVGMQQSAGESEEQYAQRLNMAKQMVQQLTALFNDLDNLLLGWKVDAKTNNTYLDLEIAAKTGTKTAEQFAQMKSGKTQFAGLLLPDATATTSSIGTLSEFQVAQAQTALAEARKALPKELEKCPVLTEDQRKSALQPLNDMLDVAQKTIEAKKTDAMLALVLDPGAVTFMAGSAIADGAKLEKALEQLLAIATKGEKGLPKSVELAADTYQGIHLHTVSMPTPQPELVPLVGDTLNIVVAIADDKVFVAAGRDAVEKLKQAIDKSKDSADIEVQPFEFKLSVERLAKFLAEVGDDEQVKGTAAMLASLLEKGGGKDHVTLTGSAIPLGVRVRLQLEEGLLKALGAMGQAMSGMGGTPAGGLSP